MLAGAVLLALTGAAAHAQPTGASSEIKALKSTVEELRKQLQELKKGNQPAATPALEQARVQELSKQLNELRDQLKRSQDGAAAATAPVPEGQEESQEALDARTPASKADIQGLRADMENYKYDQSRLQERNIPSVTRNTKIGGSLTLGYQTWGPSVPAGNTSAFGAEAAGQARKNGFTSPVLGLNFTGNLYRDYAEGRNLTYRLAFSSASNYGSSTNLSSASADGSQFNATDAYLRYSFQPASGNLEDPLGTITVGQQTVPFGLDAQALDPEVRAAISSATYVGGLGFNKRQIGVVVAGDIDPYVDFTNNYRAPLLSYAFGVYNGNGSNKQDNNSARDFSARLVYTLPVDYSSWFRQLQIGASFYRGYPTLNTATTSSAAAVYRKGNFDRTGFDINWTHLPFSVSYEWAYGKQDVQPLAANLLLNGDGEKRSVYQYVNFGYTWGEQFLSSSKQQGKFDDYWPKSYQAFLRFDSADPNRSATALDDKSLTTTAGLNVFFAETTSFKVNYVHVHNFYRAAPAVAGTPRGSNGIQAQFSATF
ncbi:hypothetical protein [Aquabacterium sp.]|uniref:hypothetical protein n=1 Tax=Aquabacterium sp. TaxID=1872578 RepID=UPI003BF5E868